MIPSWFVVVSICIRLFSGSQYAWGIFKGKAQPNPVTWFLWGLTPIITLTAQMQDGFSGQSAMLLALGLSPLVICVIGIAKCGIRPYLTPFTLSCGAIALAGIVLWKITALPELAIIFSILADIFATLPTLRKAYQDPSTEYATPYMISILSMTVTLLAIQTWVFSVFAFPLYMLGINVALFCFAYFPLRQIVSSFRLRRVSVPAPESNSK
jgi:hypothetical protein